MDYWFNDLDALVCGRMERLSEETDSDINVVRYIKGNERYVFLFDDDSLKDFFEVLRKFIKNPELSLTSIEAGFLSREMIKRYQQSRLEEGFENSSKGYSFDSDGLDGYLSKDDFSGD